jgi:outer membrane protein assembly factor BamB
VKPGFHKTRHRQLSDHTDSLARALSRRHATNARPPWIGRPFERWLRRGWVLAGCAGLWAALASTLSAPVPEIVWEFRAGHVVKSSPVIAPDGTIYFGSADRKLYALAADGQKKWEYTTGGGIEATPALGPDGTIYVGSLDRFLYAVTPDGQRRWAFPTGSFILGKAAITESNLVYFGCVDGRFYALNRDGTERWKLTLGKGITCSPAVARDGTVYLAAPDRRVYALNPDGSVKWRYECAAALASPIALSHDGTVYCGADDGTLLALDRQGGKKWEFATSGAVFSSPVIGRDGIVLFATYGNETLLHCLAADGRPLWGFRLRGTKWVKHNVNAYFPANLSAPTLLEDGTVIIGSDDKKLYAIGPDAAERWSLPLTQNVETTAAIGRDGTIYFGATDYKFYAVKGDSPLATTDWPTLGGDAARSSRMPPSPPPLPR